MSKAAPLSHPIRYRNFILAPAGEGVDLVDPATGRWAHFPTQRYAKWSATFLGNIEARFGRNPVLSSFPQPQEN